MSITLFELKHQAVQSLQVNLDRSPPTFLSLSLFFDVGEEPGIETKADSQVLLTQSMILMFLSVDTKVISILQMK